MRSISFEMSSCSFLVRREKSPRAIDVSRSGRCLMRLWMVRKLVSVPPSQRLLTNGRPARAASISTVSRACFLVPMMSTSPPVATTSRTNLIAVVEPGDGLLQVDDVDAVALGEDELAHLRVPAAGLVAEVDAGLQQLLHADRGNQGVLQQCGA